MVMMLLGETFGGGGGTVSSIGWNSGNAGGSGGGSSDFRMIAGDLLSRLIVAGGGGGGYYTSRGSDAGTGSIKNFGYGEGYAGGGAGGGGWFGGTGSSNGGGGGSSYVFSESTANDYPSGCKLTSEHFLSNAQTTAGNQSFPAPGGGNETGHTGNGYARITLVE